jgi:hypothetical protein
MGLQCSNNVAALVATSGLFIITILAMAALKTQADGSSLMDSRFEATQYGSRAMYISVIQVRYL